MALVRVLATVLVGFLTIWGVSAVVTHVAFAPGVVPLVRCLAVPALVAVWLASSTVICLVWEI